MSKDKLVIAAAGSGKTTYLVNEALKVQEERVLITTYTNANEQEIIKKFIELNGCVPFNITIQTWFSFLLQHGVKPFQSFITSREIKGMLLVSRKSGLKFKGKFPVYYPESEIDKYYFTENSKIYSDKISKFVVNCNKVSSNLTIKRLEKNFKYIFIDEVQDLAGFDLEIIKLILKSSIQILLVGDPRQVTYLTHHESKYSPYKDGRIKDFLLEKCKRICPIIDEKSLNKSHRCNQMICDYSSKLFPQLTECGSSQNKVTGHDGVFFVKEEDLDLYLEKFNPVQLRNDRRKKVDKRYPIYNFGESKGLTFDRVVIYPTKPQLEWIFNNNHEKFKVTSKCKLYVALTRARYSVAIVYNYKKDTAIDGINNYIL